MATDFRSGRDFQRRGRDVYGEYTWLRRVFGAPAQRDAANQYVLVERLHNLEQEDVDEGVVVS